MEIFPRLSSAEQAAFRLKALFESYGCRPYKMSKFQEYDYYAANRSFLNSNHILTFTDLDGKLLALKPDVTLSIVRQVKNDETSKVYYHENVYRPDPAGLHYREIQQTGVEYIGDLGLLETCEVLAMAARAMGSFSRENVLTLSHMGLVLGLFEEAGLSDTDRETVTTLLRDKNTHELKAYLEQLDLPGNLRNRFIELSSFSGTMETVLPLLENWAASPATYSAYKELCAIWSVLKNEPFADTLRLDFSFLNSTSYYDGIIFQGFLRGVPRAVLSGGRYDSLLQKLGKAGNAIGFAVYLDRLPAQKSTVKSDDILLLYKEENPAADVFSKAQALRAEGKRVTVAREIPQGVAFQTVLQFGE